MEKSSDLPMDVADASLVWLREQSGVMDIATLDHRDFDIYRSNRGQALRNVLSAQGCRAPRPRSFR